MMNERFVTRLTIAGVALLSLALGSCTFLQPKADPTRYYLLEPLSPGEVAERRGSLFSGKTEVSVGVGPVRFPEYLRKPQLVTRVASNRLEVSQIDRWAEPLDADFTRVLANNIGTLLETDRILIFPWYATPQIDYRVSAEVIRFEGTAGGEARLNVRWVILPGGANEPALEVRESDLREPFRATGPEASVQALSRALGRFSVEVAASIRSHVPSR